MTSVNEAIEVVKAELSKNIIGSQKNFVEMVEMRIGWAMDEIKRIVANSYLDNCKIDDENIPQDIDSAEEKLVDEIVEG